MTQFLNPGFESVSNNLPTSWTILNERFIAGQQYTVGGVTFTSPLDPTYPTNNASRNLADDDAISGFIYTSSISTATQTAGSNSLELFSSGRSVGFGVVRGPWVYSSDFAVTGGQQLTFDWKAEGGGDAFDVFGFLVNTATGATQIVLNETGGFTKSDGSGTWGSTTNWESAAVTVADSGTYRFVFLSGTFDESGGTVLGAKLFLDNFGGAAVFGDIQYSANTFSEASANDGTIANTISITLNSNTDFAAASGSSNTFDGTQYTISNVPTGLTAVVTRTGNKTATIQLTSDNNNLHANANDVSNIVFSFTDAAFTGGAVASTIGNATNQKLYIDYFDVGNTAPTGVGNLTLPDAAEDSTPAGTAISGMGGLSFLDGDAGSALGGVVVVGNTAAASTQGVWQYSTNGGTNWSAIGTVSESAGLSLAATTLVRFLPAENYYGTPPVLTVRALDNTAGLYSSTGTSEARVLINASNNGGGTAIAGGTNTNTIGVTITAVNDAPTVTSSGTTAYTENAAATAVNSALTIADIDNTTLASATVSITANFQTSQDVLAFTNSDATAMGNITGTYDATTGVLSLTSAGASATVAQWQAALRAVTYANTSDAPSTASRTVSFVVNDGTVNSSAGTRTVTVAATNDAPTIANLNTDAPNGTTGSPIKLDAGTAVAVTDPDSSDFNSGTLTITTASGTADGSFSLDGTNAKAGADAGTANAAIAASEKVYVGATEIGTVNGTNTGQAGATLTITFNASATPALVQTLLQNLSYTSSTTGSRNFNVVLTDGDGGTSSTAAVSLSINNPPAPEPEPETPPTPTPTPPPPSTNDGDNVPPATENLAPAPSTPGAVRGDGNGDGVLDSQQSNVTSTTFRTTDQITQNPGAPQTFVTLAAEGAGGSTTGTGAPLITSVQQRDAPTDLPESMSAPLGLIAFTAELAEGATSGSFSLYVDPSLGVNGYWKQVDGVWINLASEAYGGRMVEEGGKLRLDFVIEDGGVFDADGEADGTITDPGAIGSMPLSITEHQPVVANDGFWF